jgi:hypothetical protein
MLNRYRISSHTPHDQAIEAWSVAGGKCFIICVPKKRPAAVATGVAVREPS